MTDEKFNPFEVVDADGERSIRGRLSGQPQRIWKSDEIWTCIAVGEPGDPGGGSTVARLAGLWEPELGSIIQLGSPNRDAIVFKKVYQVTPLGFYCVVYIQDSMRDGDLREPRTHVPALLEKLAADAEPGRLQ